MGDLSKHFSRDEFACKDRCNFDTVDAELLELLENISEKFDSPITITSGCRCEAYNKTVGGKKNSQHLRGRAAENDGKWPDGDAKEGWEGFSEIDGL